MLIKPNFHVNKSILFNIRYFQLCFELWLHVVCFDPHYPEFREESASLPPSFWEKFG